MHWDPRSYLSGTIEDVDEKGIAGIAWTSRVHQKELRVRKYYVSMPVRPPSAMILGRIMFRVAQAAGHRPKLSLQEDLISFKHIVCT